MSPVLAVSMCLAIAAIGCKSGDKTHDDPPLAITLPPAEPDVVDGVSCKTKGHDVWFEVAGKTLYCAASDGGVIAVLDHGKELTYDFGQVFLPFSNESLEAKRYRLDYDAPDGRKLVTNAAFGMLAKWLRGVASGAVKHDGFAPAGERMVVLVQPTGILDVNWPSRPFREATIVASAEDTHAPRPGGSCVLQDKVGRPVTLERVQVDAKVTAIDLATGKISTKEVPSANECPDSQWVEQDLVGHVRDNKVRAEPKWFDVTAWLETL